MCILLRTNKTDCVTIVRSRLKRNVVKKKSRRWLTVASVLIPSEPVAFSDEDETKSRRRANKKIENGAKKSDSNDATSTAKRT